jgi:hypothetical protein
MMSVATSLKRDSVDHSAIMNFDNAIQQAVGAGLHAYVLAGMLRESGAHTRHV